MKTNPCSHFPNPFVVFFWNQRNKISCPKYSISYHRICHQFPLISGLGIFWNVWKIRVPRGPPQRGRLGGWKKVPQTLLLRLKMTHVIKCCYCVRVIRWTLCDLYVVTAVARRAFLALCNGLPFQWEMCELVAETRREWALPEQTSAVAVTYLGLLHTNWFRRHHLFLMTSHADLNFWKVIPIRFWCLNLLV